jgi:hypothetical protein
MLGAGAKAPMIGHSRPLAQGRAHMMAYQPEIGTVGLPTTEPAFARKMIATDRARTPSSTIVLLAL